MITVLPSDPVKRGRAKLLLLAAFFALPVIAGYAAFFLGLTPGSNANYGELIAPRPLADTALQRADGRPFRLSELGGKWVFVQFDAAVCDAYCERKLYFMRQVRTAQGKDMTRVERVWLLTDAGSPKAELLAAITGTHLVRALDRRLVAEFPAERAVSDHVYLIDPLGNLMMRYRRDPDPSRMIKDLQRLMEVSRMG